jgi:hypothetical protein
VFSFKFLVLFNVVPFVSVSCIFRESSRAFILTHSQSVYILCQFI